MRLVEQWILHGDLPYGDLRPTPQFRFSGIVAERVREVTNAPIRDVISLLVPFWTDIGHLNDPPTTTRTAAAAVSGSGSRTTGVVGDAAQGLGPTLDKGGNNFYLRGSTTTASLSQAILGYIPTCTHAGPTLAWQGSSAS